MKKKIKDLKPGDRLDLEEDKYADPTKDNPERKEVLALIDAQNIYYTPKRLYGGRQIDYKKLREKISLGRASDQIVYLVADSLIDQTSFLSRLRSMGYITRMKVLIYRNEEVLNSNWDPEIIRDATSFMPFYETIVLVSGDGGYAPLLSDLRKQGKRVEVVCFDSDFSPLLADKAHEVRFLGGSDLM